MGIYIVFFDLIKIAPELHGKEKCALMYQIKILCSQYCIVFSLNSQQPLIARILPRRRESLIL